MYCVRQVDKTPTIILNNVVLRVHLVVISFYKPYLERKKCQVFRSWCFSDTGTISYRNLTGKPIPAAARLLGLWVRNPPMALMSVYCEFVFSGRGLWVGLITRPEEPKWLWCAQWVWSPNPVRDGHNPESGRRATGKKENLTAKLMNFSAGPKPTTHRDCLTIENDSNWFGEGTSDGRKGSYRVWISPSQNVLERITGSSHYAQLISCTCHVNGPYGSDTWLHKHEYELTKHWMRKHQMACKIQTTMLRRPENSL